MSAFPPIAIVGFSGMFPDAPTPERFWENILQRHVSASEPPPGRWPLPTGDLYSLETGARDKAYSTRACFLKPDDVPDPADLSFASAVLPGQPLDAVPPAQLDPLYHLAIHAGRRAFDDARAERWDRSRIGVILGNLALPTDSASRLAWQHYGKAFEQALGVTTPSAPVHPLNSFVAGLPALLVAHTLGLGGRSHALDAACASSLYAIKLACDELQAGRADAMLAGGISRPDCLYTQMGFSQLRALSPTGVPAPFDRKANGLVTGEGAGIFVLRRLEDAVRDGDQIHGVIRGIGLSNDIGGKLLAPSSEGQLRAMRAAYAQAGWEPATVDLIECHATGTPVGDAVEFESMRQLWQDTSAARCVIGSVKSNVGHLLTAAGAAALTKVLFALRTETLPPTASFETPPDTIDLEHSPFTVLTEAQPWPRRTENAPRRAAVSAFGFGGINAHVLVEEWIPGVSVAPAPAAPRPFAPIAVVGLAARTAGADSTESFARRVLYGGTNAEAIEAYPDLKVPPQRFRIPPRELEEMLPQQVLALETALGAWEDAGLSPQERPDAAVFLGVALDMNTTNFHVRWMFREKARHWAQTLGRPASGPAFEQWLEELRDSYGPPLTANRVMGALASVAASRIARELKTGGPCFALAGEDASGGHALHAAVDALQRGEVNVALAGAVDLSTDLRAAAGYQNLFPDLKGMTDGAGAVVMKRLDDAKRDGDTIYAVINELRNGAPIASSLDAEYLESPLRGGDAGGTCVAQGHVAEQIGHAGAATGILAFIKTVLCLHQQVLPATESPRREPEPWLHDRALGPRRARVEMPGLSLARFQAALSAPEEHKRQPASWDLAPSVQEELFVVFGGNARALLEQLDRLRHVSISANIQATTAAWRKQNRSGAGLLACTFVARSTEELLFQVDALTAHLRNSPDQAFDSRTVLGQPALQDRVFYAPRPLARDGKIAFVFPGSGNQFAEMGRELLLHFPAIVRAQDDENQYLRSQFRPEVFWNVESVEPLADDHEAMIFGQVTLGVAVSDLARAFGITPNAVIGYSLGETAGLFALRAWRARDEMLLRVKDSRLFTHDLAGDCEAARRRWKLPKQEAVDWVLGVIDRPMKVAKAALANSKKVYPLIANTLHESVIGGNRRAVEKLIKTLQCQFIPLKGVTTVHCEVVKEVEVEYRALHLFETDPPAGVRFYSGAWGRAYEVTRESAADSVLAQAIDGVDFPRVIEAAYAEGVRVFIEMGPGNSCTRMIGRILGDRPHVARALCHPGQPACSLLLRGLAHLAAEGVAINEELLDHAIEPPKAASGLVRVGSIHPPFHLHALVDPSDPSDPSDPLPIPSVGRASSRAETPPSPQPAPSPAFLAAADTRPVVAQWLAAATAQADAHAAYLRFSDMMTTALAQVAALGKSGVQAFVSMPAAMPVDPPRALNRAQCLEFGRGRIGAVLGRRYQEIDAHPTRVRLPDEPLMLVDRITAIEGEPLSMTPGRVVTEHDVLQEGWYLDGGRIPTCIAVEAGQADLFLSGFLGIDLETRGLAMYRLLDADVTFHRGLPQAGEVIRYDIHIDRFFRHGNPWFFHFHFDAFVGNDLLMTMRNGCAGFFTPAELAAGQGVVTPNIDLAAPDANSNAEACFVPLRRESYSESQLDALRAGDLAQCFGPAFHQLPLQQPLRLPGGRMRLVHRVTNLDPAGGKFGLGHIRAEADIHPDDWFLICHFVDDRVMPGTLMYECCLHTLRVLLMRMGWVGEQGAAAWEPVPGVSSRLKCRGQVLESTRVVTYEVTLKKLGFNPAPFAIADARMYADGKAIVDITDMSVQLTGQTREGLYALWSAAAPAAGIAAVKPALYTEASILEFAEGRPSLAFGAPYKVFDEERFIARLPRPPYAFVSRITEVNHPPFVMTAGGTVEAQYDIPADAWYFAADRQQEMPFAILLEAVLQACGWFSSYMGSALQSDTDLKYRNLGGAAMQFLPVTPQTGLLTTRIRCTNVSQSGGMIIQHFEMEAFTPEGRAYAGTTYFGFFSREALANQIGIRDANPWTPTDDALAACTPQPYPAEAPFPGERLRMADTIEAYLPEGGPQGLGFVRGSKRVNPDEWFFQAHFYQDPVWPGSLGLESFWQLLKFAAAQRWGVSEATRFCTPALDTKHEWIYRGQVLPTQGMVTVDAVITAVDDQSRTITGDGMLFVDGRPIYEMKHFALQCE